MEAVALPFPSLPEAAGELAPSIDVGRSAGESAHERLREAGAEGLSIQELLTIILCGPGGSENAAGPLAADTLCKAGGSLKELGRLGIAELCAKGLTQKRAARIVAALELGRRAMMPAPAPIRLESPEQAAAFLLPRYQHRDRECFGIVMLGARNSYLGKRVVAVGTLDSCVVHARDVFRPCIEVGCARVLLWHVHPSGDPTPSVEDVALTRRLTEVGKLIGIEVVDHLVLGDGRFESIGTAQAGSLPSVPLRVA